MTVTLDNKRRGSFGPSFKPGDSFQREVSGETVIFRKVIVPGNRPGRVRRVKLGNYSVGVSDHPVSEEAIKAVLAEFP